MKGYLPALLCSLIIVSCTLCAFPAGEARSACLDEADGLVEAIETIDSVEAFRKTADWDKLIKKARIVSSRVKAGAYGDALDKLVNDVLPKIDGCAGDEYGAPDRDDWMDSCQYQVPVYNQASELRDCLKDVLGW